MPTTGRRDDATPVVVGVDVGGTGTRFVATDPASGDVVARLTVPTPRTTGADAVLAFFREHLDRVDPRRRRVAVGIGASGPVDADGVIRNPDTLPAFTDVPIVDIVATLVPGAVVIDNDAVCAALAERSVGAARRSDRSLHVTLGTGVGVCLLLGDTPWRHAGGGHPEGGHIAVVGPTPPCYCGRAACWEQAASRRSLQRTAARILDRSPTDRGVLADLAGLAARGDHAAGAAFDRYGTALADGLATLLTLYGPDLVVVGGSAAPYLPLYRAAVDDALTALGGWIPPHEITATQLDDYGGAIGGAVLATAATAAR